MAETFTKSDLMRYCLPGDPPDIRWADFHDTEHGRFATGEAWSAGGIMWATDSRILIAAETVVPDSPETINENGRALKRPPVQRVLLDCLGGMLTWRLWPHENRVTSRVDYHDICVDCRGLKLANIAQCPQCKGAGYSICEECESEVVCKKCHGNGEIGTGGPCPTCNGTGTWKGVQVMPSGAEIDARYDRIIRRLGAVECSMPDDLAAGILFRGPGFVGVLMPLEPRT